MQVAMQPRFEAALPFAHPNLASEATLLSLCSPLRSVAPGVLMLVCKQWQRAYLACPALHSKLVLILTAVDSSAETIDSWLVSTGQHLQRWGGSAPPCPSAPLGRAPPQRAWRSCLACSAACSPPT